MRYAIAALSILVLTACGGTTSAPPPTARAALRTVVYRLTPSGYVTISPAERAAMGLAPETGPKVTDGVVGTLRNGTGGIEQKTVNTPAELSTPCRPAHLPT